MRKELATDSPPPPDCSLSNETDARLDRSSVRTGHMPPAKSMRLLRLPKVMQQTGLKKTKLYELQRKVLSQCESRSRRILLDELRRKSKRGSREGWLPASRYA